MYMYACIYICIYTYIEPTETNWDIKHEMTRNCITTFLESIEPNKKKIIGCI